MVTKRRGTNKVSPTIALTLLPRENFQAVKKGKSTQAEPCSLPELRRQSSMSRETKGARFCGTTVPEGSELHRDFWRYAEGSLSSEY